MQPPNSFSISSAIVYCVVALLGVSLAISVLFGEFAHWPPILLAIGVSLWAARVLNQ